ncbi:MAG: family N-acetyltransferase [Marmoricola sp.]|nr:family N-acetyltransferase [Marmoricola sp.]
MTARHTPPIADVLLADGTIASIRSFVPDDAADLVALHDLASDESTRMRFFSLNRLSGHAYTARLVAGRPEDRIALVAHLHGELVGLATAEIAGDSAEVSFLVSDTTHGVGVGTLLLEHLAAAARAGGVRTFTADVLTENHPMLRVFADAGFVATKRSRGTTTTWEISTSPSESAVDAADQRERIAETRSLGPMLYPQSVAVLGARRAGDGIGNAVLRSITDGGFTGATYVVHPSAEVIGGLPAYRSLVDVPGHVDVAVVAVPARLVLDAVADAAAAGASAVVVITSGFGELGQTGTDLQRGILQLARDHDMRLVGPNCLGLLCNDPAISLNATFTGSVPLAGGLAIASQSGGVGIALLDQARDLGIGVHSFVSLGNQPDVCGADLLAAWQDDPRVTVAALYLESFGMPRKFARLARRFSERKPLLAVVGGRSAGGARAGASHTAAAATPAMGVEALFAQAGVISCRTTDELVHAARLLTEQPFPHGARVAIVSNAGGLAILAADSADEIGLEVPELSDGLKAEIGLHLSGTIGVGNPIDLGAAAQPEDVGAVVELLASSIEVDAVLVAVVPTSVSDPGPVVDAITRARRAGPDKPVLIVAMGGLRVEPDDLPEDHHGVTAYRTSEDALKALAHAARYSAWLTSPRETWVEDDQDRAYAARAMATRWLDTSTGGDLWLGQSAQTELLSPYGITPIGELVCGRAAVAQAAERVGYPVVLKVADPQVVHKTDRGLVRVGVRSPARVLTAIREFELELHDEDVPVLVQPVLTGVELALGLVRHETFGPLIMVAAGGVATDLWQDRTFLMPPVTSRDAARALRSLRIWPLLQGYRGSAALDTASLEQLIVNLGHLADDVPEVCELDLNPVMVTEAGARVVDVKVRLHPTSAPAGLVPRQLSTSGHG